MTFLSAIFNPTMLIFIGILLLITSLLVVYFENKMREQNHKISSMLSLVSSLAEETNMIKYHLTHANMNTYTSQNSSLDNIIPNLHISGNSFEKTLIDVSDDDDDDDDDVDDDDDDDDDDDEDDEDDDDDDDDDDEEDDDEEDDKKNIIINEVSENDIKILNLDNNDFYDNDDNNNDDNDDNDDDDLEDLDLNEFTDNDSFNEENNSKNLDEVKSIVSNVKSINILNLEEEKSKNTEVIDYKKLALGKLKAIVLEKGLVDDSSKLKKPELLKLLNAE